MLTTTPWGSPSLFHETHCFVFFISGCPYGQELLPCKKIWCYFKEFTGFCCETCPIMFKCSSGHYRQKRSNYFNAAIKKKATSFLKSYINLVTMKQNQQVVDSNDLEERQTDFAKCPQMNTDQYKYCNKLVFSKSKSACYDQLISQLCCQACTLVMDKKSQGKIPSKKMCSSVLSRLKCLVRIEFITKAVNTF